MVALLCCCRSLGWLGWLGLGKNEPMTDVGTDHGMRDKTSKPNPKSTKQNNSLRVHVRTIRCATIRSLFGRKIPY